MNIVAPALRIMRERRRVLVPLAALLALNILAYLFLVYPLAQRVANVEERDRTAEQTLEAARGEHDSAEGTLTGKDRASAELATFYGEILPSNLAGARRLTYPRLEEMATSVGLEAQNYRFETVEVRDSSLTRAKVQMALTGSYEGMRMFLHQLEASPEFVVVDDVGLAEGSAAERDLALTIQLSTYFRTDEP
jgi:Tfp pilus assembly protein PilO